MCLSHKSTECHSYRLGCEWCPMSWESYNQLILNLQRSMLSPSEWSLYSLTQPWTACFPFLHLNNSHCSFIERSYHPLFCNLFPHLLNPHCGQVSLAEVPLTSWTSLVWSSYQLRWHCLLAWLPIPLDCELFEGGVYVLYFCIARLCFSYHRIDLSACLLNKLMNELKVLMLLKLGIHRMCSNP